MVEGRIRISIKKNLFQKNLSKECEKVNRWALKFLMPSRNSKWFQHENARGQSLHVFAILIYSVSSPNNANIREKPDMLKWSSDLLGRTAPATTSPLCTRHHKQVWTYCVWCLCFLCFQILSEQPSHKCHSRHSCMAQQLQSATAPQPTAICHSATAAATAICHCSRHGRRRPTEVNAIIMSETCWQLLARRKCSHFQNLRLWGEQCTIWMHLVCHCAKPSSWEEAGPNRHIQKSLKVCFWRSTYPLI